MKVLVLIPSLLSGLTACAPTEESTESRSMYRLPYADGITVQVFDDFGSHRPRGRIDLFAVDGPRPYRIVAAAAGRIVAIEDRFSEQQSGRPASECRNNYVWIAHPNGEWTGYSHFMHGTIARNAGLKMGDWVEEGAYLGDEGAVGCAMLPHLHFEVATPAGNQPLDQGGFLIDNDDGKRARNPRFCGVEGDLVLQGETYQARAC